MNPDQKYLIKYFGDASKKNLYWFKDKEDWVGDPNRATQFNNPEGITEVGRLLVEHEWVTRLIPTEEIQMVKPASPPNSGFILVVDGDGDIVENYPENSVIDVIFRRMELLDKEFPSDSPHSAWRWVTGGFTRVFDRIGEDPQ